MRRVDLERRQFVAHIWLRSKSTFISNLLMQLVDFLLKSSIHVVFELPRESAESKCIFGLHEMSMGTFGYYAQISQQILYAVT